MRKTTSPQYPETLCDEEQDFLLEYSDDLTEELTEYAPIDWAALGDHYLEGPAHGLLEVTDWIAP